MGTGLQEVGTEEHLLGEPTKRHNHAMAYDSKRGVTLLFGGDTKSDQEEEDPDSLLGDLWQWDGETWKEIQTQGHGQASGAVTMAFDEERGVTLLFGGYESQLNEDVTGFSDPEGCAKQEGAQRPLAMGWPVWTELWVYA